MHLFGQDSIRELRMYQKNVVLLQSESSLLISIEQLISHG